MHEAHFTQVLAHDLRGHGHVSPRISKRCRIFTPSSCDVHGLGRVTLKPSHALFQVREVGSQRNVVMPRDQISVQKPCLNGGRSHEGHIEGYMWLSHVTCWLTWSMPLYLRVQMSVQ